MTGNVWEWTSDSTRRGTLRLRNASTAAGATAVAAELEAGVGPGVDAAGLYVGLTRGRHWNEAIVVAESADAASEELVDAMRRGVPEPTIEDSRRAAQIDLNRAARRVVAPAAMDPVVRPAASRGLGI